MLCTLMYRQNGDLANLLKLAPKKSAPECPNECGEGGQILFGQCPNRVDMNFKGAPLTSLQVLTWLQVLTPLQLLMPLQELTPLQVLTPLQALTTLQVLTLLQVLTPLQVFTPFSPQGPKGPQTKATVHPLQMLASQIQYLHRCKYLHCSFFGKLPF